MILPIDNLYELSFHLVYLLKIQPSEVNNLTVHESRSYINYYQALKDKEKEYINKANNNNSNSITHRPRVRKYSRR